MNRTEEPYPAEASVAALFEQCTQQNPDAPAVVYKTDMLSYSELNGLANRLAQELLDLGFEPGGTIAISARRSPDLIVGLLAILKCGGTYVPVDQTWPDARLQGLLQTANCRWILTDEASTLAKWLDGCIVIPLHVDSWTGSPADNPNIDISSEAIAYINFTSGSTGQPKGVPIRHRSISRLVFSARYADLGPDSSLLQLAPVTFDAATFEIWGALLRGGTCVLYPSDFIRLSALEKELVDHSVTVLFLTTALFNTVVDEHPEALRSLKTVLTGGEAHSIPHMAKALQLYGTDRVVHVYGPTECTTFATYHPVRTLGADGRTLPIGRPIQNTRLYVVNEERLCEPGQHGEIWLAGDGLSPGYIGLPDITRDRFIDVDIAGTRQHIYRTGDIGWLLPDGDVVFHGRQDDQVKINGFRIELGEITHRLNLHPAVRQSYVVVDETGTGDKTLVAFVVPESQGEPAKELKDYLQGHLPAYMIPRTIYSCDALPLSATGKIDRSALLSLHKQSGTEPS